jgi:hypothetical protein
MEQLPPAGWKGDYRVMRRLRQLWLPMLLVCFTPAVVSAQTAPVEQSGGSFRVQCPTATIRHPGSTATESSRGKVCLPA